jgi:hypothetical protein
MKVGSVHCVFSLLSIESTYPLPIELRDSFRVTKIITTHHGLAQEGNGAQEESQGAGERKGIVWW